MPPFAWLLLAGGAAYFWTQKEGKPATPAPPPPPTKAEKRAALLREFNAQWLAFKQARGTPAEGARLALEQAGRYGQTTGQQTASTAGAAWGRQQLQRGDPGGLGLKRGDPGGLGVRPRW